MVITDEGNLELYGKGYDKIKKYGENIISVTPRLCQLCNKNKAKAVAKQLAIGRKI